MIAVNLIVMCLISQGDKGVYPTYLIANYEDQANYYTVSQSKAETPPVNLPGKKIEKKACKMIYNYDKL